MRAKDVFYGSYQDDGEKPALVTFRLDKRHLESLDHISKQECVSRSFMIRRVIQRFIEDYQREDRGG